uniref:Chorein N-terminal domain-containing protein n=1 Tax=Accipiter nisus TaxID=211598 RepID=A0A8B9N9P9_9AVES
MVLESVVADLLNRFLGDYVENLNKSQLKLGIWGGKEPLLSPASSPRRCGAAAVMGDKLTLKIPWKNLYGEAVVATLEGLYLLIVPGASIKYDAEKEEKYLQDNKQKELARIEEALQKAAEKGRKRKKYKKHFKRPFKGHDHSKDKPKEEKKDTFLEKLATQVIKNVQVKITGIHVKYEDDVSIRNIYLLILNWTPVQPVSASVRLYINPYAEAELKTPKLDCNVEVQRIVIEFTKPQYLSMIDLLESIDYMVRNAPYRRFRPNVSLHKNARQWWKYAGNSVLEVHIKRYTRMWSWSNIKQHRQLLKSYKNMYKNKLTQSKLSEETQRQIQVCVFSFLCQQNLSTVENKWEEKCLSLLIKLKVFVGFWFLAIDELMTPEEKAKLFTAIGYSDSSYHVSLPKQYVAHVVTLKLLSTSLTIKEDKNVAETLKVQIIDLSTKISQRPGAQAIKVEAKLENWYVTGLRQENIVPSLVASIGDSKSSLLKIEFNVNPEDSTADQSLTIESQPVEIKYDARTINAMVEFFQTSKGMDLERLTSATLMKLEEIKERTATGLVHIIEMRKVLDLKINLKPSYLVVPQTGFYHEKSDLLILDFGTFQLNSINQGSSQASSFSSLEEIMDKAYDKFDVEIKNVQLLFGRTGNKTT